MNDMKIKVDAQLKEEIRAEIHKATEFVEKQMAYSEDLRNYDIIAKYAQHIADLRRILESQFLNLAA